MLVHLTLERPSIGQLILLLAGSQARAPTSKPHQISLIYRLPDIQHLDHFSLRCSLLILKRSHDLTLIRRDLLLRLHLLLLSRHRRGCFLLWFLRHCGIAFVIFGRRNNVAKRKGIFPRHLHLLVPPHLLQLLLGHLGLGDSSRPGSCRTLRFGCVWPCLLLYVLERERSRSALVKVYLLLGEFRARILTFHATCCYRIHLVHLRWSCRWRLIHILLQLDFLDGLLECDRSRWFHLITLTLSTLVLVVNKEHLLVVLILFQI